jgi:hypothetical protein
MMDLWCCHTRKELFNFENGSFVYAKNAEDAIQKLKSTKTILKVPDSETEYFEFDSGVRVKAPTAVDAQWKMYMDKRDPMFTWTWARRS